ADLVDRDFVRAEPDQLWVTDITEHRTREGKVYCSVVLSVVPSSISTTVVVRSRRRWPRLQLV
ncbi:MAG: IS3 family transposase, partial [Acidimicrobiia bacterium]